MDAFKALHILSMFAMVTVFSGGEFLYSHAVWRRDVRALAWLYQNLEQQIHLPVFGLGFSPPGSYSDCSPRSPADSTSSRAG